MTLGFSRFSHSRPANLLQRAFFSESSETLVKYFKSYEVTRRWEPKAYYLIFQEEQLVFKRDPKGVPLVSVNGCM